jgi:hypothetical protein
MNREGNQRRSNQQEVEGIVVLVDEPEPRRLSGLRSQPIEAMTVPKIEHLRIAQAFRARFQLLGNTVGFQSMPRNSFPPLGMDRWTHV